MKNRTGRTVLNVAIPADLFRRWNSARSLAGQEQALAIAEMMIRYCERKFVEAGLQPTKPE